MRWELHTLDGNFLARLERRRAGGRVDFAFNGDRTARVALSIYDPACEHVEPLTRLLKVWHDGPDPVFTGPLMLPSWDGEQATVELSAQGPSARLDAAPLILAARSDGTMPDLESLDVLVDMARPPIYGFDDPAVPDHGIRHYAGALRKPMPILEVSRGESVWALMLRCGKSMYGPDFDLRPVTQTPGTWDYCELDIWTRRGVELQDDPALTFHYGHGKNNVAAAGYAPGGDQVRNAFHSGYTIGSGDEQTERVVLYYDPPSIVSYGVWAAYENAGCQGSSGKGIATVAAYRQPPRHFTFQPAIEGYVYAGRADERFGVPPRVLADYGPGDTIRVVAKKGYFRQDLVGRVRDVALIELDEAGNTQPEVTIVPGVDGEGIASEIAAEE